MSDTAQTVQCRCPLADGSALTLTATRRPRAGRAEVKGSVPDDPRLAERMQQVVRLARLTEPGFDSRDQVVLSIDRRPPPEERGWELAAVLADRAVRGLLRPGAALAANGWSDEWERGRVAGHTLAAASPQAGVLLGGAGGLPHLGMLSGHGDPAGAVSTVRAWFPLHSGEAGGLGWVEVSVHPLARLAGQEAQEEEQTIAAPDQDAARQLAVRQTLCGSRHFDGRGLGRWRTAVRFGPEAFAGRSWELALVMADRLARGLRAARAPDRERLFERLACRAGRPGRRHRPQVRAAAARGRAGRPHPVAARLAGTAPGRLRGAVARARGEPGLRGADRHHLMHAHDCRAYNGIAGRLLESPGS
jgi:hypothetical protein